MANQELDMHKTEALPIESGDCSINFCYPNNSYCHRHQEIVNVQNLLCEKIHVINSSEELGDDFMGNDGSEDLVIDVILYTSCDQI